MQCDVNRWDDEEDAWESALERYPLRNFGLYSVMTNIVPMMSSHNEGTKWAYRLAVSYI